MHPGRPDDVSEQASLRDEVTFSNGVMLKLYLPIRGTWYGRIGGGAVLYVDAYLEGPHCPKCDAIGGKYVKYSYKTGGILGFMQSDAYGYTHSLCSEKLDYADFKGEFGRIVSALEKSIKSTLG